MEPKELETFVSLAGQNFSNTKREVQMEALLMFGKCICAMEAVDVAKYRSVITSILQLLTILLQNGDETNAQKLLQVLIDIASENVTFFRQHISELIKMCTALSTENNLEAGTRTLGLEILCMVVFSAL